MARIPWQRIVRLAIVGTVLMTLGVLIDVEAKGGHIVGLIQPGADGPSADVFAEDFPELELPDDIGHDGQQFYVMARNPTDVDALESRLDRPRYRLQRPLFPLLSWVLHPTGGGRGLIAAMFVVGVGALLASGVAAGALSTALGGGSWPALLVPLLPGAYAALRLSLADTLALALLLLSLLMSERGRAAPAAACGALGVLAKESILVVLVGHAVFRRTRSAVLAAIGSTVVAGLWWVLLRFSVEADSAQVVEFTWPLGGVVRSLDDWVAGDDWIAGLTVIGGFVLAGVALVRRGPTHPLFGAVLAGTVFSLFLARNVVGLDFNATRTLGPVVVLAILTLGTPAPATPVSDSAERSRRRSESRRHAAAAKCGGELA